MPKQLSEPHHPRPPSPFHSFLQPCVFTFEKAVTFSSFYWLALGEKYIHYTAPYLKTLKLPQKFSMDTLTLSLFHCGEWIHKMLCFPARDIELRISCLFSLGDILKCVGPCRIGLAFCTCSQAICTGFITHRMACKELANEEWVRQRFLGCLWIILGCPKQLIAKRISRILRKMK